MQHPRNDCPQKIFEARPENRNKEENIKESKHERILRNQMTTDTGTSMR